MVTMDELYGQENGCSNSRRLVLRAELSIKQKFEDFDRDIYSMSVSENLIGFIADKLKIC